MNLVGKLSEQTVRQLSKMKREPNWLLDLRLEAYQEFCRLALPADYPQIDLDFGNLVYYNSLISNENQPVDRWSSVPKAIKNIYQQIGLPENEQHYLAGAQIQIDSRMVYQQLFTSWADSGIIFTDTDTAVQQYPELVKKYLSQVVDYHGNKLAALNTALWSGGSFIYVPPNVRLPIPLQANFRINISNLGQFERSLIILAEGASLKYVEGCSSPIFNSDSLHDSVVEIIVGPRARMSYLAVQNWSTNVLNIVSSRMLVDSEAIGEWVDINIGSKITKKCPRIDLIGERASGHILSLTTAQTGQYQDSGGTIVHNACNTTSSIISKSISNDGGACLYHGNIIVESVAQLAKATTKCDSLLLDATSRADTFPVSQIKRADADVNHEATTGRIDQAKLFYLLSRGFNLDDATNLIIRGFAKPIIQKLPLEYSGELNKLLKIYFGQPSEDIDG